MKSEITEVLLNYLDSPERVRNYMRCAGIKWNDLTAIQKEVAIAVGIVNGCGGRRFGWLLPKTRHAACCEQHDWNYMLGGDNVDRARADLQFLVAMLKDSVHLRGFDCWFHIGSALLFYLAVRLFGWTCWEKANTKKEGWE